MRVIYVPLEPYEERYTLQLRDWTIREFERLQISHLIIDGDSLDVSKKIKSGFVLDAHQRCFYALSQIQKLIKLHLEGGFKQGDMLLFEDMFHPGLESIWYINQLALKKFPPIAARCLAQTIDPDDFVHYSGMAPYMRKFEEMVLPLIDILFMNSEEMRKFMVSANWPIAKAIATGVPFGKQEVIERLGEPLREFSERKLRVVFASRVAQEKQPEFFIAIAKHFKENEIMPNLEFAVASGGSLSSALVDNAVLKGYVNVYPHQTKKEYYQILNDSRVLFNSSLQDWVSVTAPEADALGCNLLFPAYRSFPGVFSFDSLRLYIPWSTVDAVRKLLVLLDFPIHQGLISDAQDKSIERTLSCMDHFLDNEGLV